MFALGIVAAIAATFVVPVFVEAVTERSDYGFAAWLAMALCDVALFAMFHPA